MSRSPVPTPETTPSWAYGVRRRLPFYVLAALLLALLAGVVTFIYLEQLRASMVPTAEALVARQCSQSGKPITDTMIKVRSVPEEVVLPSGDEWC